jgi:hypothetical protein
MINDVLLDGMLVERGSINSDSLRKMLSANQRGEEDHAQAIWQLLTLEYWMRGRARVQ